MESLGIEGKLLLGQIVNFLLLFGILGIFLYKPVVKMLEDRRQTIAESLENAKKIENNLAEAEKNTKEALAKAAQEARLILDEASKLASAEKKKTIEEAQKQSDRIIAAAQNEAKLMKDGVIREARKEIVAVVTLALDKIVGTGLDDQDKKKLTYKAIKEI